MILMIVKAVLLVLTGLTYYKAARAKKLDPTLEYKMDMRSRVEFIVVILFDLFVIVAQASGDKEIYLVLFGQLMIVITFFHTKRYVFAGKNILYMLEHPFYVKDVQQVYYEKGIFHLTIRNTATKVRLPVGDVDYLLERFSGKRFQ